MHAFDEPTGYGKLPFLAKEAEIKKTFPKATLVVPSKEVPDGTLKLPDPPFTMNHYEMTGDFGPLKNCKINLQCFKEVFYQAGVVCPQDAATVEKHLRSRFGPPTKTPKPNILEWYGDRTHVSFNSKGNAFLIEDLNTSLSASRTIQAYIASQVGGGAPQQ